MDAWRVALLAVVLALGAAACGDGAAENDRSASRAPAPSEGGGATIKAVLAGIQADYVRGDGAAYCAKLTPAGAREVARFGRTVGQGTTCAGVVETSSRLGREIGIEQEPTKLLSVEVKGDRAVARVSNGGRPAERMVFVRRDGEWKIPDSGWDLPEPGGGYGASRNGG